MSLPNQPDDALRKKIIANLIQNDELRKTADTDNLLVVAESLVNLFHRAQELRELEAQLTILQRANGQRRCGCTVCDFIGDAIAELNLKKAALLEGREG